MIIGDLKIVKFIIVGAINTIIGSAIMFIAYNVIGLNYWISSCSNYFLTSILSFFLNKHFTFNVKNFSVLMVLNFIAVIITSYLIAYSVAKPLINRILQSSPQKLRENIALLTGMCFFTGLNYIGQKLFVFKEKNDAT
jgi:putative flippase GtrA